MNQPVSVNNYPIAVGTSSTSPFIEIFQTRDPNGNDFNYQVQQRWWNVTTGNEWVLVKFDSAGGTVQAVWEPISGAGLVEFLVGNTGGPVGPNAAHEINVIGDGTTVTTAGNPATNTLTISTGGTVATSYVEDTGTAVPSGGILNVLGGTAIATTGSGNTITINAEGSVATTYDGNTGTATPLANVLNIVGTGNVSTAASGNTVTISSSDTAGIVTINGNTGSVTGTTVTLTTGAANVHGTAIFSGSGTTMILIPEDGNANTGWGSQSLAVIGSGGGTNNSAFGGNSLASATSATENSAFGGGSLGALTTGAANTAYGEGSAINLVSGSDGIFLGASAGVAYTGAESSNIIIGNSGVISESNVIRIGTQGSSAGQQTSCYIAGIAGVTVANSAAVLINTATGQLGTVSSSRRYKENIVPMEDYSSKILELEPVQFNYIGFDEPCVGLIAEDVNESIPSLVVHKDNKPETVKYHDLPVFLLNEIKKLNQRIISLENKC
jgi:hypothetical protein